MSDFIAALFNPDVPFIRMAFLAGIIGSIPFGFIGSFVVVRKMSSVAGAVSHSILGGIGLALYMSTVLGVVWLTPTIGAFAFALIAAGILSAVMTFGKERLDTVIGAVWAVGMSLGLLFIAKTPGYIDPMSYLFGNILLISSGELLTIAIFSLVVLAAGIVFYPQLQAVSFDAEFAQTRGLNIRVYQTIILILISVTVVLMVSLVGTVMVIAFLTIPPAMASVFSRRLSGMILYSILFSIILSITGLVVSYQLDMATGSVTIILAAAAYILLRVFKIIFDRIRMKASK